MHLCLTSLAKQQPIGASSTIAFAVGLVTHARSYSLVFRNKWS